MQDMELDEVPDSLENEQQFWTELDKILSKQCGTHALIDNVLRAYLGFSAKFKGDYLASEYEISRCSYKLFSSNLFVQHADYIRRQIIYSLLQEDDPDILHFIVSFLLFDGRQNDGTFQLMNEEGSFARLLELVYSAHANFDDGAGLHRLLMDLLYEMSRIQRIKIEDLVLVEDDFVRYLFEIIEGLSDDAHDPYHYPVIRVLLVLNEQFMVSAHDPASGTPTSPLTNKVMKILSMHGNIYKTFGENIILLLNREGETSLQLLTLKLLYLVFTTPSTYEYFFTNDLHVLVDILIRNLLDLPEEAVALRHTYLRVLYPLLAHTQLKYPPHYKRNEIKRTLSILVHSRIETTDYDREKIMHFGEADETTKRLVSRCSQVDWMSDPGSESRPSPSIPQQDGPIDGAGVPILDTDIMHRKSADLAESPISEVSDSTSSPIKLVPGSPSASYTPDEKSAGILGMNLKPATSSTLSVLEVAAQKEKPGVMTPSIKDMTSSAMSPHAAISVKTRPKPQPPKTRRWREHHTKEGSDDSRGRSAVLDEHHAVTITDNHESANEVLSVPNLSTSRSTSRSAPALPPPRRSFHHTSPNASTPEHQAIPLPPHGLPTKLSVKPLPPKTRRWQHGAKLSTELAMVGDMEGTTSPASTTGSLPRSSDNPQADSELTENLEEAVGSINLET